MEPFIQVSGIVAPLLRTNVDTDQIAPGKSIMRLEKAGSGKGLFANWRYCQDGSENLEFVLNQERFRKAKFLLSGANFGCGSSREIAVWALADFGIRALVAPSFGTIFANNCYANGVLPVVLPEDQVMAIAAEIDGGGDLLAIDLEAGRVSTGSGQNYEFHIPRRQRGMLLNGLDAVELTLTHNERIAAFQLADMATRPWVYQCQRIGRAA